MSPSVLATRFLEDTAGAQKEQIEGLELALSGQIEQGVDEKVSVWFDFSAPGNVELSIPGLILDEGGWIITASESEKKPINRSIPLAEMVENLCMGYGGPRLLKKEKQALQAHAAALRAAANQIDEHIHSYD